MSTPLPLPADFVGRAFSSESSVAPFARVVGHTFDEDVKQRRELMTSAMALVAQGKIKVPQAHLLKLSEVRHAHELLDQGLVSGKIVMQI